MIWLDLDTKTSIHSRKETSIAHYKAVADYSLHVTDEATVEAFGYQKMNEQSGT